MANPKPSNPMKKGETRNPNGRPKKGESLTECMRIFLEEAPPGQEKTYKELFVRKSYQKAIEGDPTFAKLVWNYVEGMPKQSVNVDAKVTNKDLQSLSDDDLRAIIEGRSGTES